MRIVERAKIKATTGEIWEYLSQPTRWPEFVEKIETIEPLDGGFYRILISRKEAIGKIESLDTGKLLRFSGMLAAQPDKPGFAIEYRLEAKNRHTLVSEIQELLIPFPFNLLVKLVMKLGRKQSPSNLDRLKKLCEER